MDELEKAAVVGVVALLLFGPGICVAAICGLLGVSFWKCVGIGALVTVIRWLM